MSSHCLSLSDFVDMYLYVSQPELLFFVQHKETLFSPSSAITHYECWFFLSTRVTDHLHNPTPPPPSYCWPFGAPSQRSASGLRPVCSHFREVCVCLVTTEVWALAFGFCLKSYCSVLTFFVVSIFPSSLVNSCHMVWKSACSKFLTWTDFTGGHFIFCWMEANSCIRGDGKCMLWKMVGSRVRCMTLVVNGLKHAKTWFGPFKHLSLGGISGRKICNIARSTLPCNFFHTSIFKKKKCFSCTRTIQNLLLL